MIIKCSKCSKNFEIDENLISNEGTLVQCGSCQYKWYQKKEIYEDNDENKIISSKKEFTNINDNINTNLDLIKNKNQIIDKKTKSKRSNVDEVKKILAEKKHYKRKKRLEEIDNIKLQIINERNNTDKKKSRKNVNKEKSIGFISIILIFFISISAVYLILDTFQLQITKYWPSFENYFYYINETLINIYLLIKDLIKSYS